MSIPTDDEREALRIAHLDARQTAYREDRALWFRDYDNAPEIATNAFFRGWDASADGGFRRSEVPEPSAEDEFVEWAYESDCLEGECAHRDEDGEPEDMSVCPNVPPFEVCVGCMEDEGRGSDPEQWDDVPLMPWPCPAALRAAGVGGEGR